MFFYRYSNILSIHFLSNKHDYAVRNAHKSDLTGLKIKDWEVRIREDFKYQQNKN